MSISRVALQLRRWAIASCAGERVKTRGETLWHISNVFAMNRLAASWQLICCNVAERVVFMNPHGS